MKLHKKILLTISLGLISMFSQVSAAGLDHFEVLLSPDNVKVGEFLDLTIKAVDKNNNVIPDYNGTIIIFGETDSDTILPAILENNTYEFSNADQGVVTFENSVSFKRPGKQEISVYDLTDDTILGIAQTTISENSSQENKEIKIVYPESGLTIGDNTIKISGETTKNHAVKVLLNGQNEFITTSNEDGIFEIETQGLIEGENTFTAEVLNSDKEVIGSSNSVKIKVELNKLVLKNIKISPTTVPAEAKYDIEIIANPGLKEVTAIIDDSITQLKETTQGTYTASAFAPKKSGDFVVDVILKNDIGHETKELGAAILKVTEPELPSASEKLPEVETKELNSADPSLEIKNLKLIELKTKSILTWDPIENVEGYNVYKKTSDNNSLELIKKVDEPKIEIEITGDEVKYEYFAVKAIAKNKDGIIYEGDLSEATKIKTGPELIILFLISILSAGLFLTLGRKSRA